MATFQTFTSTVLVTAAMCFIASTNGSTITCNFLTTPVYEGDTKVTLSCVLNNINIDYAVTVKRNGAEVTPRITLNAATTYEVPNSRYTVRTTAPQDRGDSTEIGYFLDITNVTREDDGWYVLEVLAYASSNFIISTGTDILDVYYLPDGPPICSPNDVYVVLGHEFQLICTVPAGKPSDSVSLQWEYQSTIITGTTTISNDALTNNEAFTSPNVETIYVTCLMSFDMPFQDEPARTCQAGPINIIGDPVISVTPERLTVLPGENASFTCDIEHEPIAARIWYYDGISSERFVQTGENNEGVMITNVQLQDSGTITCRVNTGGSSYKKGFAQLIVTESPPTMTRPTTSPSQHGQSAILLSTPSTTSKRQEKYISTVSTRDPDFPQSEKSIISNPTTPSKSIFVTDVVSEDSGNSLFTGIGIGIGVTVVLVLIIMGTVCLVILMRRRREKTDSPRNAGQELQPNRPRENELTGASLYADLDRNEFQDSTYSELNPKVNYVF